MNIDILSSNLKRYRGKKNLTQQTLSELSGVSLPTIKNIERKKALPKTSTLLSLSRALDCRLLDLVKPVRELSSVRFRARKRMNKREQVLAQVSKWLDDYIFLENVLLIEESYSFRTLAEIPVKLHPVQYAEKARKIACLQEDEPIHDICGLLESCGIKILTFPYSSDAFNGLSVGVEDYGPAIIINTWERISVERQIFSTAHELGHLLMHISQYSRDVTAEDKVQEREADLFAGHFLMPELGFDLAWQQSSGMPFVDRVMKIKTIFRVSYKTVLYRLIQKGIVNDSVWIRFQQLYEAKYKKKLAFKEEPFLEGAEPFGLKPFNFSADRLGQLVRRALEEEKISLSRAAEIMNLPTQQMMKLTAQWEDLG